MNLTWAAIKDKPATYIIGAMVVGAIMVSPVGFFAYANKINIPKRTEIVKEWCTKYDGAFTNNENGIAYCAKPKLMTQAELNFQIDEAASDYPVRLRGGGTLSQFKAGRTNNHNPF